MHFYPSQCGGWLSVPGFDAYKVASSLWGGLSSFSPLWSTRGEYAGILPYYSMPALLHLGNSTTFGGLGVGCHQPSLDVSGKVCLSSSHLSSSSSVHVSDRTCQRPTQTFDSGGSMLGGGSLASHSFQHFGRHSSAVSHNKRSHCGCFGRPCVQGSAISVFNPLATQRFVLCRQGFSSSVCQTVAGATWASVLKVYQQCWNEWTG